MKKNMTVEVKFTRKNNKYSVRLKALHNGSHLTEKTHYESNNIKELFDLASAYITKHDATNIALKRGLLEDSFAKYLTEISESLIEEDKTIEGVSVDSVSESGQELLADLRAYKMCVEDTIRHKDYESLLFQGILYNYVRQELMFSEKVEANPYEMVCDIPLSEKEDLLSAGLELRKAELAKGIEPFKVEKHNRVVIFTKSDYKLTVNLV